MVRGDGGFTERRLFCHVFLAERMLNGYKWDKSEHTKYIHVAHCSVSTHCVYYYREIGYFLFFMSPFHSSSL